MRNILLVIRQEFLTTISKRSFWIMTFLMPALILALTFGSQLFAERTITEQAQNEATFVRLPVGYIDLAGVIKTIPEATSGIELVRFENEATALQAIEIGDLERYYLIPVDYLASGALTMVVREYSPLSDLESSSEFEYTLKSNLVEDADLASLLINPAHELQIHRQAPPDPSSEGSAENFSSFIVPYATLFIFFLLISMTGGMMLSSVSKEKENRTLEILLLSIQPRELMFGKLLGLSMIALLQMSFWLAAAWMGLGSAGELNLGYIGIRSPGFIFWALAFLLLGYLLFASMLGAIGAIAPTAREGSQFSMLVLLPLMIPLVLTTSFTEDPGGPVATALSLFPFTAPSAMLARLANSIVPPWQPAAALIGLAVTTYLMVNFATRFFRSDTLLSSPGLNWKKIRRLGLRKND
jgi:ABC-2 type transport system permease protein